ncbi:GNAT family N-acetyltransferase [Jannaschia sp. Os4]|uniref:GNAT family N-acetyltransferase n=1 Tax=Jannaschia sp. Os4 TaxID=2807617 RepID=UPI00193ABDD0|nr:GNAT family N-acetyltransferase [Jannaschia sp. Os4]MBM2575257.1 GNAT family N-acetyltransferase [Jannaschia sp. Os4]
MDGLDIRPAAATEAQVAALIAAHGAHSAAHSPDTDDHTLDADALGAPGLRVWAGEAAGRVVVIGALKDLGDGTFEVKSVHTSAAARGRGLAARMMAHLAAVARADGAAALVLETGSDRLTGYGAARRLYERLGYVACGAIPGYADGPASAFYRLDLARGAAAPQRLKPDAARR